MRAFTFASAVLAFGAPILAAPAPALAVAQAEATELPFSVIAARSGSPIHLQSINANGLRFWIGKQTATYCPVKPKQCPPGKETVFVGGHKTLSMDDEVPGGQQVYVTKKGALGFTQAHSAEIPPGAKTTGFHIHQGSSFGTLSAKGGFVACPIGPQGPYQIFVQVPGFTKTGCLGFDALTSNYTKGAAAWQYT